MKLGTRELAILEDPQNEQALIDLLKRLAVPDRMVPPAAHEALEKALRDLDASGKPGGVSLDVNRAPVSPRAVEWRVGVGGVVVASSQPHLIGRRRSA